MNVAKETGLIAPSMRHNPMQTRLEAFKVVPRESRLFTSLSRILLGTLLRGFAFREKQFVSGLKHNTRSAARPLVLLEKVWDRWHLREAERARWPQGVPSCSEGLARVPYREADTNGVTELPAFPSAAGADPGGDTGPAVRLCSSGGRFCPPKLRSGR